MFVVNVAAVRAGVVGHRSGHGYTAAAAAAAESRQTGPAAACGRAYNVEAAAGRNFNCGRLARKVYPCAARTPLLARRTARA